MMKKISLMMALALVMAACSLMPKRPDQANTSTSSSSSSTSSSSSGAKPSTGGDTGGETVERPSPTAAQTAAIEGGQTVNWDQQGMTFTLPANWKKMSAETLSFQYNNGSGNLIVSISPMGEDFPTDISLKAYYDGAKTRKKNGEIDELRYLEIDGVKGVQFRESPEKPDDFKRLQWLAYRKFAGQTQMVNLMLSTYNKDFPKQQDAFYGILYSTKVVH